MCCTCDDNVEPYSKQLFVIFSPKMFTRTGHFRGVKLRTIHSKIHDLNGPKKVALNCILLLTRAVVECCFTSTETVDLLGTGAQNGHLDFHTAPELCIREVHAGMQLERREINSPLRFAGRTD